ncbi:hypothetical protein FA15DRAFT_752275 [Coprinopsis marcescibilis]|uniref:Uncharacterized protein n=1 Tax=Coprinopsis marcescibilis TaxID=230819 RepID=A0A5C3LC41_COPMA|nr:hypothetical protein FA15DRAFT_752275 [Coprinopsis marcescibilis]
MVAPTVLNVHTPSSSFAIAHSLTEESLTDLYDKLSRKTHTDYYGERVGPGWLKYEYNAATWNLDDDSDYAIFTWRQREQQPEHVHGVAGQIPSGAPPSLLRNTDQIGGNGLASSSRMTLVNEEAAQRQSPTLHLHNPAVPLPGPPAYCNPSYYIFQPSRAHHCHVHGDKLRAESTHRSIGKGSTGKSTKAGHKKPTNELPNFKRDFEKFHSENGVRTVMGSIGPVENVRMLLKAGHRHVYISRKFAVKHGFVPPDSAPGNYGYGGLLCIGEWPITLTPSASSLSNDETHHQLHPHLTTLISNNPSPYSSPRTRYLQTANSGIVAASASVSGNVAHTNGGGAHGHPLLMHTDALSIKSSAPTVRSKKSNSRSYEHTAAKNGLKPVMVEVYLSEEPHFDVVLGRSFCEKRQIKTNAVDPTDVWCLDTGEKIECELVILKDGRGEIVTVT